MSAASEREAVGTILSGWTTTPVAWPNKDFDPPVAGEWIAVTLRQGDAYQLEICGPQVIHRHPGVLFVQVFAKSNKGDLRTLQLADSVAALFRRAAFSFTNGTVQFRSPAIRAVGVDGAYFQVNVTVPYYRDVLY